MNKKMYDLGNNRSIIRELFEFSKLQKAKLGEDMVYDFSIGNPSVPPHEEVNKTLIDLLENEDPCYIHGYTSAQGDNLVREEIAKDLNLRFNTAYTINNLYMTCGAAASLCIAFKALTEKPSDEFLAIAPYFTEYKVFVETQGAAFNVVPALMKSFDININELEKMIGPNTKGIIVNSPNNPSGVIYKEDSIIKLASLLREKEVLYNHPIYIICDEPYREIAYDGINVPHIPNYYNNTIVCYSYSKSLSLPGERIGYILVPNSVKDHEEIYKACLGAGRGLGYVCAPSIFQHLIAKCSTLTSNMSLYKENRDVIYNGLKEIGYECVHPMGAFYLFFKSPSGDAYEFMERAKKHNIIVVPSDPFGVKGYLRLAYCVKKETLISSLPGFKKIFDEYK